MELQSQKSRINPQNDKIIILYEINTNKSN